jgi:hypothetical protein
MAVGDDVGDAVDGARGTASEGVAVAAAGEAADCVLADLEAESRRTDFFLTVTVKGEVAR